MCDKEIGIVAIGPGRRYSKKNTGRFSMKFQHQFWQSENYDQFILHRRKMLQLHFELDLPLFPFCFEDETRQVPAWFEATPCDYVMLVAVEEGQYLFRINERKFRITPGKILFVPEFTPYRFSSSGFCHRYVLELKGCHLSSICNSLQLSKPELFDFGKDDRFLDALKTLGEAVDCTDSGRFIGLMAETYRLLAWLALRRSAHVPKPSQLPQLLKVLEQDLERRVSIAELCELTGLNKATLTRMVKRNIGMTPIQYRAQRRIERSIYFLQTPGMSVKEIAYRLGYCNQFYFSEEFKRITGRTPTEYRRYQKTLPREE